MAAADLATLCQQGKKYYECIKDLLIYDVQFIILQRMCNRAAWIMLCSTQNLHQAPLAICSPAPPPRHCYPGQ